MVHYVVKMYVPCIWKQSTDLMLLMLMLRCASCVSFIMTLHNEAVLHLWDVLYSPNPREAPNSPLVTSEMIASGLPWPFSEATMSGHLSLMSLSLSERIFTNKGWKNELHSSASPIWLFSTVFLGSSSILKIKSINNNPKEKKKHLQASYTQ